jgi:prepilin-type N-terminal cleavage/methylation domain-containing protein
MMKLKAQHKTSRRLVSAALGSSAVPTRGFTLIELITVISIMAVVGAIAIPIVLTTTTYRKVNAAMLAASGAIQSARYLSLSKGVPYQITFNAASGTYQIFQCSNCAATIYTPTSTFTYAAADPPLDRPIPYSSGTTAAPNAGAILGASQTIYFRPGGAVQWVADGTTSCSAPLSMTFTYQSVSKTLTVECYGRVKVPQ